MSNYSKIKTYDIANGIGIRTSVFFSGCDTCCENCFNKNLWDFTVGEPFTKEVYETKIKPTIHDHIAGLSILGGEPMHSRNVEAVQDLLHWFRQDFPTKTVWLWTGYDLPVLQSDPTKHQVLEACDVVVYGPFVEAEKDLSIPFRGSRNQRIIDVAKTMERGEVVLWEDKK